MPNLRTFAWDRTLIEITIDGLDELARRLDQASLNIILRRPMNESVIHIEGKMKEYPPQRSGSSYRRTGTLGRRWTHTVSEGGDEIRGNVGNNTVYGPYVQSQQLQARVHQGLWQTDLEVTTEEVDTVVGFFERAVDDALDG